MLLFLGYMSRECLFVNLYQYKLTKSFLIVYSVALLNTVAMVKNVRDKKKRAKWSENDLQSAMAAVISGCSQRSAASRFNIPKRTLHNHIDLGNTGKTLGRLY